MARSSRRVGPSGQAIASATSFVDAAGPARTFGIPRRTAVPQICVLQQPQIIPIICDLTPMALASPSTILLFSIAKRLGDTRRRRQDDFRAVMRTGALKKCDPAMLC